MSSQQKPLPKWTIWVRKPHSLMGSRKMESIDEALRSVYGLDCNYLGFRWDYHQIQVYNGSKIIVQQAAQAVLFLHHKWIRETVNPPWIGICDVTVTVREELPAWVIELERERQLQEGLERGK